MGYLATAATLCRLFPAALATLSWLALATQFLLYLLASPFTLVGIAATLFRFAVFFTILANILVAIVVTALVRHRHPPGFLRVPPPPAPRPFTFSSSTSSTRCCCVTSGIPPASSKSSISCCTTSSRSHT